MLKVSNFKYDKVVVDSTWFKLSLKKKFKLQSVAAADAKLWRTTRPVAKLSVRRDRSV
jgi:hypothetical protein